METRECRKCLQVFPITEIQLSHDVPRYIGGTDLDGRHSLCKRCHYVYERKVFAVMLQVASDDVQDKMRDAAKAFAKKYFKEWHDKHPNP